MSDVLVEESYDVVCLSHLRWDWVYQRPQHLMTRCAEQHRVFFVEEPLYDSGSPYLDQAARHDVRVLVPHLPPGYDGETAARAQRRLLDTFFEEQRVRRYVLWYYTPMAIDFTRHLDPLAVVYDCMDELSAFNGAHTAFPVLGVEIPEFAHEKESTRNFVVVTDEEILNECQEPRQQVWIVDITSEARPMVVSGWTVPEASGNFCERGGRFGSHSSNESMAPVYYKKMAFISFFNAGVRALDIRDPYHPTEVGYFIPSITASTDKRCVKVDGKDRCKVAIQTNNVETDERGYIYIVDRANTGLHVLELTGPTRAIAFP